MPDPKRLAGTLSQASRKALERAAERALRETNPAVEPEHFLLELFRGPNTDAAFLLREGGIDLAPTDVAEPEQEQLVPKRQSLLLVGGGEVDRDVLA